MTEPLTFVRFLKALQPWELTMLKVGLGHILEPQPLVRLEAFNAIVEEERRRASTSS